MKAENNRNYGIDLLRIVSMLMICTLHILGQGGLLGIGDVPASLSPGTMRNEISLLLWTITIGAVDGYALISGYVGVYSDVKWKNIVRLWGQVAFYSVVLTLPFRILNIGNWGLYSFRVALFPVLNDIYWYFTGYFCLMFFMPYLNQLLCSLDDKGLIKLSVLIFVFFSVVQTQFSQIFFTNNGYCVLWLTLLYLLGGCIRRGHWDKKFSSWFWWGLYLVCILVSRIWGAEMQSYIAPPVLLGSAALLVLFSRLKLCKWQKKWISKLAPLTFAVYLLHTHPLVFTYGIMNRFVFLSMVKPIWFVLGLLACVLGLYAICSALEALRRAVFHLLYIDRLMDQIGNLLENTESKLFDWLLRQA